MHKRRIEFNFALVNRCLRSFFGVKRPQGANAFLRLRLFANPKRVARKFLGRRLPTQKQRNAKKSLSGKILWLLFLSVRSYFHARGLALANCVTSTLGD